MNSTDLVPFGGNHLPDRVPNMTGQIARQTSRDLDRVAARAVVADAVEQGRALITNTALENVGSLSALEAHLIEIAPLGESRYKHIVDAYALGAARAIARW
jgi:hypothetical protein